MIPFWILIRDVKLQQGDLLPQCKIPVLPRDFGTSPDVAAVPYRSASLIVMTQSCDLTNLKSGLVALCPAHTIQEFEAVNPRFARKGAWEEVRKGRHEGLHLLASPTNPAMSRESLVVNFREIHSLPIEYLERHSTSLGDRWRLQSPFLEHFSQAFARFFMRVGLPSAIPPFVD
jgi:hypothetical protein